jgi:hypothetical protein
MKNNNTNSQKRMLTFRNFGFITTSDVLPSRLVGVRLITKKSIKSRIVDVAKNLVEQRWKNKFKFLITLIAFWCQPLCAQSVASYNFSYSAVAYTAIAGGTLLGNTSNNDNIFNNIPIGFTFTYAGVPTTSVSVSANGFIKMVGTNSNGSSYFPISDTLSADSVVSALGSDLVATTTGALRYLTTGISPNRIFTIQWAGYRTAFASNSEKLNFQIRLLETSNIIQVNYGNFILDVGTVQKNEVGLRSKINYNNKDFNNRCVAVDPNPFIGNYNAYYYLSNAANTWSTSIAGLDSAAYCILDASTALVKKPANGTRYQWTPALLCSGTPIMGTLVCTTCADTLCPGTPFTLTMQGGINTTSSTIQWQSSLNNTTWFSIPSATTNNYSTTSATVTTYYRLLRTCSSSTAATIGKQIVVPTTALPIWPIGASDNTVCPGLQNGESVSINNLSALTNTNLGFYGVTSLLQSSANSSTWLAVAGNSVVLPYPSNISYNFNASLAPIYFRNLLSCGTLSTASAPIFINTYTGSINGGSVVTTPTLNCANGQIVQISNSSYGFTSASTVFPGITHLWQTSTNGTAWTDLNDFAFGDNFSTNFYSTTYYRDVLSCGSITANSQPVLLNSSAPSPSYATIPYLENFDAWQTRCTTNDVPSNPNWESSVVESFPGSSNANNSWRKQNGGVSSGWTSPTTGTVAPLTGSGCANLHTSQAGNFDKSHLHLFVNLSGSSGHKLTFYHKNIGGDDILTVSFNYLQPLSEAADTYLDSYQSSLYNPTEASWNKKTIYLPPVNSPSCIVRLSGNAFGNGGLGDIGIDSLQIKPCGPALSFSASSGTGAVCLGGSLTLSISAAASTLNVSSDDGSYYYSNVAPSNLSVITITNIVNSSTYSILAYDPSGCASGTSIAVNIQTVNLTVSASTPTVCIGKTATLSVLGASTYSWSNSALGSSITVSPLSNTNYTVTGTSSLGCTNTKSISLVAIASPTLLAINASTNNICPSTSVSLNVSGTIAYVWSNGASASGITVTPIITTNYSVTGTNSLGCTDTKSISIVVNPNPSVTISASKNTLCIGESASLQANGAANYLWNTGINSTSISVSPTVSAVYSVSATSNFGCIGTASTAISVFTCTGIYTNDLGEEFSIYPNPAQDKINVKVSTTDSYIFELFDINGKLLLKMPLQQEQTQINLQEFSKGVYIYKICNDKKVETAKGKLIKN